MPNLALHTVVDTPVSNVLALEVPHVVTTATPTADRFTNLSVMLRRAHIKVQQLEGQLFEQRYEVQNHKTAVTAALNNEGDFDATIRAYKAANNRLDRLIDAHYQTAVAAMKYIESLRSLLDELDPSIQVALDR